MMKFGAIAVILSGVLIAASFAANQTTPKRGGVLTFGRYVDSSVLEPALNTGNPDIWVLGNIMDTLVRASLDGKKVLPGVAVSWTPAKDNLSYSFQLRRGVKFSNGAPLTAADVKWSLERASRKDLGFWSFILANVKSVDVLAKNAVRIHLKTKDPVFLSTMSAFNAAILPKAYFMALPGKDEAAKAKVFGEKPVGSGPFKLTSWKRGESMMLARNPNYWEKGVDGKALPYLDGVKFEIITDDNTRILKLQSGELDAAEYIPFSRIDELAQDKRLKMKLFTSSEINYIAINTRNKPLSDVRVRQALNLATDKKALVALVTFGHGKPSNGFLPSSTPLWDASLPGYPFNLEQAKKLLADAGYSDGFSMSLLVRAGSADATQLGTALQQMWAQVGVKLEIKPVDTATQQSLEQSNKFDAELTYWTNDINDPSEYGGYILDPSSSDSNHTGWKDDKASALFMASQQELDPIKRKAQYQEAQKIWLEAAPFVLLYERPFPVALGQAVNDYAQTPLGNMVFIRAFLTR